MLYLLAVQETHRSLLQNHSRKESILWHSAFFVVQFSQPDMNTGKTIALTVVLEKILDSPWTLRRSNQSILKEINPEDSLEGLMLKLKLQYFGHLMQRTDSLKKTPLLTEKDWRQEEKWALEDEMANGIINSMDMSLNKL